MTMRRIRHNVTQMLMSSELQRVRAPVGARTAGAASAGRTASARRPEQEERLLGAALRCVERWGYSKTSLEDVAREAGCSRATVYRMFPGGKDALVDAVVAAETKRLFAFLAERIDSAEDLEDSLVGAASGAGAWIAGHGALQYLLAHEPELVLPRVSFSALDELLARVSSFAAPHLARWVSRDDAARLAEWVTRLVISFSVDAGGRVDITDPRSVRVLLSSFVLPGVVMLAGVREPELTVSP